MFRWLSIAAFWVAGGLSLLLVFLVSPWWLFLTVPLLAIAALGTYDLLQNSHSVLRNYPVLGHMRYLLEEIRPEIQQYFIEKDTEGTPFNRSVRDTVYQRAKATKDVEAFGTNRLLDADGYEFVRHSIGARTALPGAPRVKIGGPDCTRPYRISMYNVSAMSFGSLSANAILALNGGAARGNFAHDTGEGAISPYHMKPGGDLIWELGTAYFGCRTPEGHFDPDQFAEKAALDQVKCISIKLSQGAKPGLGGVLPGHKVTREIAETRGVPEGQTVISPPSHETIQSPVDLCHFIAQLRRLSDGKPVGFKLCVGSRKEFLGICKAIRETGIAPDFIIVDGAEGGTGAAPLEFEDNVGLPLTQGLMTVHNALVGTGLRDQIRLGASGKVASGIDIVKRVIQGADFTLAARAMMFAVGCIQAQKCHTNTCPVGVATQDPKRARALNVPDKTTRVYNLQRNVIDNAKQIVASMGLDHFYELHPSMLMRRVSATETSSYEELFEWLEPGQLIDRAPDSWHRDWERARTDAWAV